MFKEIKLYTNGRDEIIIFNIRGDGEKDFFEDGGRDREDYDMTICQLPVSFSSSVHYEAEYEVNED